MSSASRSGHDISNRGPRFIKIILEDTLQEGRLGIPTKFLKNHGSCLPNTVSLRVPNGRAWHVKLSRHNSNVWLQNGWSTFAEHYSLEYGHFLVFEHNGGGQFQVLIFDKSATEIDYLRNIIGEYKEAGKEQTEDDDSVEILDDFTANHKSRERSQLESPRPLKKRRTCSSSQIARTNCKLIELGVGEGTSAGLRSPAEVAKRKLKLMYEKNVEAFQTASSFQSVNPYFKKKMTSSYVGGRNGLFIPIGFASEFLREKESKSNIVLSVSDGRTWPATYHYTGGQQSERRAIIKFHSGWKQFLSDNSLQVGDVCIFEMIEMVEIKFKVHIFRGDEDDPNIHLSPDHGDIPNRFESKRSLEK